MADAHDALAATLDTFTKEAVQLRMGAGLPTADASTGVLLEALLDVRSRLDRLEALLADALRFRGALAREHTAIRIQVEDAWDAAAVRQRSAGVRDEYSSAKERAAATNLEVLELRRVERKADALLRRCDDTVDFLRLRLRGCQEIRQDILAVVKIRQFESAMER